MLFARDITKTNKQKNRKLENKQWNKDIYIHTHINKLQNKTNREDQKAKGLFIEQTNTIDGSPVKLIQKNKSRNKQFQ